MRGNIDNPQVRVHRIRLLLAEDDIEIRTFLCHVLQLEHEVVGFVENGAEVFQKIKEMDPDILLLDISLPGMNGLTVARRLRQSGNPIKIIFLTAHTDHAYVEEARRIGAEGYVFKRHAASELETAIQEVSRGASYFSREIESPSLL